MGSAFHALAMAVRVALEGLINLADHYLGLKAAWLVALIIVALPIIVITLA